MTLFTVTRPDLQLETLRSGLPLKEPEAMAMLALDLASLHTVARDLDNLASPRGAHQSAWVCGHRGYGKTQSLLVLGQMLAARAAKQGPRTLLLRVYGKDIGTTPVEQLILRNN